jgi:hypothetical protein
MLSTDKFSLQTAWQEIQASKVVGPRCLRLSFFAGQGAILHDLILSKTHGHAASLFLALHGVHCRLLVGVSDVGQTKRATTVLVSRELGWKGC